MVETAPAVDEKAIEWIAKNEYFSFLGEKKIREVAAATEKVLATNGVDLFNDGRWMNPAFRKEILRVLSPDLRTISETHAWMVVRRYRELKRYFKEKAELEAKRIRDEEAKAKLAAEKAAKAAAAKAAKPAAPPAGNQPASGASGPAPSVPPNPGTGSAEAAAVNAGKAPEADGKLHTPLTKDPQGSDTKKDGTPPDAKS